jgi:hypothetical protein
MAKTQAQPKYAVHTVSTGHRAVIIAGAKHATLSQARALLAHEAQVRAFAAGKPVKASKTVSVAGNVMRIAYGHEGKRTLGMMQAKASAYVKGWPMLVQFVADAATGAPAAKAPARKAKPTVKHVVATSKADKRQVASNESANKQASERPAKSTRKAVASKRPTEAQATRKLTAPCAMCGGTSDRSVKGVRTCATCADVVVKFGQALKLAKTGS